MKLLLGRLPDEQGVALAEDWRAALETQDTGLEMFLWRLGRAFSGLLVDKRVKKDARVWILDLCILEKRMERFFSHITHLGTAVHRRSLTNNLWYALDEWLKKEVPRGKKY